MIAFKNTNLIDFIKKGFDFDLIKQNSYTQLTACKLPVNSNEIILLLVMIFVTGGGLSRVIASIIAAVKD